MNRTEPRNALRPCHRAARPQRGAVAIMVGLALVALVGAGGLALDLARLYTNKSELQSGADACALAAAAELTCPVGVTSCLLNAKIAGQFAASQNKSDYQSGTVAVSDADVRFSANYVPNAGYQSAGAPANSRYAMCIARSASIATTLMRVMGINSNLVVAQAVASLQPAGAGGICPGAPIGVCPKAGGTPYVQNDWVMAVATNGGAGAGQSTGLSSPGALPAGVVGTFRWVDWDYPGGGTNEVRDRLAGVTSTCGITTTSSNIAEEGVKQGAREAWNTRFGIYARGNGGYDENQAPPDRTGFAYPTKGAGAMPIGTPSYSDYRAKQSTGTTFQGSNGPGGSYDPQGPGNPPVGGVTLTSTFHIERGTDRRLLALPILNGCTGPSNPVTVARMGCFLLLNPMSNGATVNVFMEYRGSASDPASPCSQAGAPGGGAGAGGGGGVAPGTGVALVPSLVQ